MVGAYSIGRAPKCKSTYELFLKVTIHYKKWKTISLELVDTQSTIPFHIVIGLLQRFCKFDFLLSILSKEFQRPKKDSYQIHKHQESGNTRNNFQKPKLNHQLTSWAIEQFQTLKKYLKNNQSYPDLEITIP